LARQIYDVVCKMGKFTKHKPLLVISEERLPAKITNSIIIGTPGKVNDLITRGSLPTKSIKVFVLDEADVMLDTQGLAEQTLRIKRMLPKDCQNLFFSATFSDRVAEFANKVVPKPVTSIRLKKEELSLEKIKQYYVDCGSEKNKFDVLSDIYGYLNVGQSIIFVHTIKTAQALHRQMIDAGHTVSILHGGKEMSPADRDRIIDSFRNGAIKVLISTNVLARGIDILQVSLVINYDLPLDANNRPDPETYIHRIGRSGRFGRSGIAINFVHDAQSKAVLRAIGDYYKREILQLPVEKIEDLPRILKELNLPA
jgi:ATP-dependent RNA helicase DDX19/DBP5